MSSYDPEAGHLALAFANTMNWHASAEPIEELTSYQELLDWSRQAGILTGGQAARLQRLAAASDQGAEAARLRAIELREAIYRVFATVHGGRRPEPSDLAILTEAVRASVAYGQLEPREAGFSWRWKDTENLDRPLWPVARAAVDLLRSDELARVGQCADDRGCGYLFLDTTRNHSRRWCSMDSCGNRAKARRHYRRAQAKAAS
ncbi:MAG TPA: ABATE domain-containing protein [Anaerolineales bacterium]|jgi:predicted RNA-binding Zn ribbon-like protein